MDTKTKFVVKAVRYGVPVITTHMTLNEALERAAGLYAFGMASVRQVLDQDGNEVADFRAIADKAEEMGI